MANDALPKGSEALTFRNFLICALCFVAGVSAIIYVNLTMTPSHQQEIIALLGLVVAVPTGPLALFFYLKLLWTRLANFKKDI